MQAAISSPPLSKPKPRPCLVPQRPLPSPDPVSSPRLSMAAPSEAAESSAASDSTILSPSPKLKPKPYKSYIPSKAPVPGPSQAFLPSHKKHCIYDPDSPSKSKRKPKASCGCFLSQSIFLFIFPLELNSVLISPACNIASLYGISTGHPLLEMVLALFASLSCEDLALRSIIPGLLFLVQIILLLLSFVITSLKLLKLILIVIQLTCHTVLISSWLLLGSSR